MAVDLESNVVSSDLNGKFEEIQVLRLLGEKSNRTLQYIDNTFCLGQLATAYGMQRYWIFIG